jgi:hypothetical protein
MEVPKWHRADPNPVALNSHVLGEGVYKREVGDTLQVIERITSYGTAWDAPLYRLVEVRGDKIRVIRTAEVNAAWTLRELRAAADRRARRKLAAMREP